MALPPHRERTWRLPSTELGDVRLAVSPLWEAVMSLRVLGTRGPGPHARWRERVAPRLRGSGLDLALLCALVPPAGHLADFLTPAPRGPRPTIAEQVADLRRASEDLVRTDVSILLAARPESAPLIGAGLGRPAALRDAAAAAMEQYWELVIAPDWDLLRGLDEADVTWRLARSAGGGVRSVLDSLHERMRADGDAIVVDRSCRPGLLVGRPGLVLVPCAFAWPELVFLDAPGQAPTAAYPPRGIATLWDRAEDEGRRDEALGALLGRTRAAVLAMLAVPLSTAEVAARLGVTSATANEHLQVMRRAGLVRGTRHGREVRYACTELGHALVSARPHR